MTKNAQFSFELIICISNPQYSCRK